MTRIEFMLVIKKATNDRKLMSTYNPFKRIFDLYMGKSRSLSERRSCVDPLFSHWTETKKKKEMRREYEIYDDDVAHCSYPIYEKRKDYNMCKVINLSCLLE